MIKPNTLNALGSNAGLGSDVYVTEMLRWGSEEDHHYIIGAYSTRAQAELAGDAEKSWRGGKYEYRVEKCRLDAPIPDDVMAYHRDCVTPNA